METTAGTVIGTVIGTIIKTTIGTIGWVAAVPLLLCCLPCHALRLPLDGGDWVCRARLADRSGGGADNESWAWPGHGLADGFAAAVPGQVYSDLLRSGHIQDPFFEFNSESYLWIGNTTWTYSKNFSIGADFTANKHQTIVFNGLDTYCSIYLNGDKIGGSRNMFVRYEFDVSKQIQLGENEIEIIFEPPISKAKTLFDQQAKNYTVPPTCVPQDYRGICHANHIRKMQCSFSWDWGPAIPTVGIWKSAFLQSFPTAVIRDVTVVTKKVEQEGWQLIVDVYLKTSPGERIMGQLTSMLDAKRTSYDAYVQVDQMADSNGELTVQLSMEIPSTSVDLWWPNGMGQQPLYHLRNIFSTSEFHINMGFRTIELIQKKLGRGLSFYFRVNGVPMFAKGTNWIPQSLMQDPHAHGLEFFFRSMQDTHMNMVRVWGGGVYESDLFYSLADQYGILIWQDFMFACSMYPTNEDFLSNVAEEVRSQVLRLQPHPSVALWAGNNENEAALSGNWYGTEGNFSAYQADYIRLYVDTIRRIALALDQSRPFAVSSPSNGLQTELEGYVAQNPYDGLYGDVHVYNYFSDGWDPDIYPLTRFASEYGFQSLPSYETMRAAVSSDDMLLLSFASSCNAQDHSVHHSNRSNESCHRKRHNYKHSNLLVFRQHLAGGYEYMHSLIQRHLRLPSESQASYFKTFAFFSQISQAMAVKAETESYRQQRSIEQSDGQGATMGALYWQLNDVWQAPSWSSIDFLANWKMLHYFARHFFAPLLVSPRLRKSGVVRVHAISDHLDAMQNATFQMKLFRWDNFAPIAQFNKTIPIIPPASSAVIHTFDMNQMLTEENCTKTQCFFHFALRGSHVSPDNYIFPSPLKDAEGLTKPDLRFQVLPLSTPSTDHMLQITAQAIAPFVWLQTSHIRGIFSDNGFLMLDKQRVIQFHAEQSITSGQLQRDVLITSLQDDGLFNKEKSSN